MNKIVKDHIDQAMSLFRPRQDGKADDDKKRLAEIRARCEAATPGPWDIRKGMVCADDGKQWVADVYFDDTDAPFIAAARTDLPWLLAEIERLRATETPAVIKAMVHFNEQLAERIAKEQDALRAELAEAKALLYRDQDCFEHADKSCRDWCARCRDAEATCVAIDAFLARDMKGGT